MCRLVASGLTAVNVNAVKVRRRMKNQAKRAVGTAAAATSHRQTVEDPERETGNDGCPAAMRIHRARGRAKSRGGCRVNRLPMRETCVPFAQKTAVAAHALTILRDARPASRGDDMTQ
jgi:hypothetical protein